MKSSLKGAEADGRCATSGIVVIHLYVYARARFSKALRGHNLCLVHDVAGSLFSRRDLVVLQCSRWNQRHIARSIIQASQHVKLLVGNVGNTLSCSPSEMQSTSGRYEVFTSMAMCVHESSVFHESDLHTRSAYFVKRVIVGYNLSGKQTLNPA